MRKPHPFATLALALALFVLPGAAGAASTILSPWGNPQVSALAANPAPGILDYDIPGGHFFTQTNGLPTGTSSTGFTVTNEDGVLFWDAFKKLGGANVVGYPVTQRFKYDGYVTQAMQKMVFQWRPDTKEVWFLNTFEALHDKGKDDWLLTHRQIPRPLDTAADRGLAWNQVVQRHLGFLDRNPAIKKQYEANRQAVDHYGLPVAHADMGNSFVIRAQRASFQYWKETVPWAEKGTVSVVNGGDLAKEAGLWPEAAVIPQRPSASTSNDRAGSYTVKRGDTLYAIARANGITPAALAEANGISDPNRLAAGQLLRIPGGASGPVSSPTVAPAPTSVPSSGSLPVAGSNSYRARNPEYGMNIFLWGNPATTARDLKKATDAQFRWQKTLFQWRQIEGAGKGKFDWSEADRVVKASAAAGVRIIARLDFQPSWARADGAFNGPPDNFQDFTDFVYALVTRYKSGSPYGHIDAVEIWNEPNLAREWGNKRPDAARYVRLLKAGYEGAKRADPSVTVISAGLTPTETWNDEAFPDDVYLQQMYDAGAKSYFDVLGAHGAGYRAPPEMSPDQVAADPTYGGHRFFCFRRIEDLRNVMVKNGDGGKQVWLLEFGWTSDTVHPAYAWHAVSEEQKAQYIVGAYRWAATHWSPWIGVMTLWNLPDPSWTTEREEYWWSIANADGSDRPAYSQLKQARLSGQLP